MRVPQLPVGLGLLLICHLQVAMVLFGKGAEAKQKCQLQVQNAQVVFEPPSSSAGTAGPSPTTTATSKGSLPAVSTSSSSGLPSPTAFNYGVDKIRGVNLGGWLVLEPWITPSIFESTGNVNIVDEFTLGQMMDNNAALNLLTNHWETWITEDDFAAISAAGLNHVRIPLGYWSVPLTSADTNTSTSVSPYIPGAWPYLLKGLNWARKHNVHVIIDLHGAPGSQNGYDNSGQRTSSPVWALNPANITRTIDTLRFVVESVGGLVDVIELLNEPAGFDGDNWVAAIRQFWLDGYGAVKAAEAGVKVMIGDAFLGVSSWTNFLTYPAEDVLMDFHEYQIFSDLELSRSFQDHINFACGYIQSLGSYAASNLWTVLGEWSNAVTDCAQWLNGRGVGARWDGTWFPSSSSVVHGSCANFTGNMNGFSNDYKTFLRKYWEVQVDVGENIQGWVFWTWKAENADEWSYQRGLQGGWIPQDPTNRLYPGICNS